MAVDEATELGEENMELSKVGKTIDGTGLAYYQLDCVGKNVNQIKILESYEHLRQIDLSRNSIQDVAPLGKLLDVLRLNLAGNAIESIDAWQPEALAHLLYLDLSGNQMTALPALHLPALKSASFAANKIATCKAFCGHAKLQTLDLSDNALSDLEGVSKMPKLEILRVGGNALSGIAGVGETPALQTLDISKNKLPELAGSWELLATLTSLDISGNMIVTPAGLEQLRKLPDLRKFETGEQFPPPAPPPPAEGEEDAPPPEPEQPEPVKLERLESLIFQSKIEALDGEEVTDEERDEAKALHERRLEEEAERIRQEEEAKREAEAAAAEAAAAAAAEGAEEEG
jgi:hypothetical protein